MSLGTGGVGPRAAAFVMALAAACSTVLAVPSASAAPIGRTLVVLGDSFTATSPFVGGDPDGCTRPPTAWPARLAAASGLLGTPGYEDVSCSGGSIDTGGGWTLVHQARKAAADGAFGDSTRAVLIQIGWNDTWGASPGRAFPSIDCLMDVIRGCGFDAISQGRLPDFLAVTPLAFADRTREVVNYIKYYAPKSRIVFVGYPEVFPPGQSTACLSLPAGGQVVQPRAEGYIAFLDHLDAAQRGAAGVLGVEFFDARSVTARHGSCAADSWIGGFTEPNSLFVGAPIHPSVAGNEVLAAALRAQLGL
ncbi:SGNH/GDSL hydrolase family protein [Antrihabitans stalactiti]|nr:SGNH/GDSL hydrolase family protein [Antrihabitans stalactiti]